MLKDILRLSFLGFLVIAIAGCEVSDPGSALTNERPKTYIVLAPPDSAVFNHFVHLKWYGNDPDGEIAGFWIENWAILADGDTLIDSVMYTVMFSEFTQAYEDTIAFYAPGDTIVPHRFQVTAVDNEGDMDPAPASRFFYAQNTRPSLAFAETSVPEGAVVGKGFAIELEGIDPNPSSLLYSIAIDDTVGGWEPWSAYPTFLFCDKSLDFLPCTTATWLDVPCSAYLIDKDVLTAGDHTIYARVIDAGEALGTEMISLSLTVTDTARPIMDTVVTGAYGSDEFYADGSVFYKRDRETKLTFSASAAGYHGQINAYRYHLGDGDFTDDDQWQESAEIVLLNAPSEPTAYVFRIVARDVAGELSNTISHRMYILEAAFTDSILIVDETRDGTGGAGSPNDEQADDFYEAMVGSRPHTQLDYASHKIPPTPEGVSYLSPLDLYRFGLVIYHSDDKANFNLSDTRVVLAEYMDRGGKVIFSGWDLLSPFGTVGPDSASYSATGSFPEQFVYNYMRLFYAVKSSGTSPRECMGFQRHPDASSGYPDSVAIQPDKVPPRWNGALDKCWTFNNRGETNTLATFDAADDESRFEGRPCVHVYLGPTYSVAVIGLPLYFCVETEAQAFMNQLLTEMGY